MEEVEFVCRECGWKGSSPMVKSWSEPSSTHRGPQGEDVHVPAHSGSMKRCPECEKTVRTQKDWELKDKQDYWIPRVLFAVVFLGVIYFVYNLV